MTHNKRKKFSRMRGSHTHGGGAKKKRRGAGHRGGRGNAGSGKRGDAKKPSFWKIKNYYGKHGFTSIKRIKFKALNIKDLEQRAEGMVKEGLAKKESNFYVVDFKDLGYNKLLSAGDAKSKFKITVVYASKDAVEKIKKAGGEVTGLKPKKEKKVRHKEAKKPVEDEPEEEQKEEKKKETPKEKKGSEKVPITAQSAEE